LIVLDWIWAFPRPRRLDTLCYSTTGSGVGSSPGSRVREPVPASLHFGVCLIQLSGTDSLISIRLSPSVAPNAKENQNSANISDKIENKKAVFAPGWTEGASGNDIDAGSVC
jgi:hypothetical protein